MPKIQAAYYYLTKVLGEFQPATGTVVRLAGYQPAQVLDFNPDGQRVTIQVPDNLCHHIKNKLVGVVMDVVEVPFDAYQAVNQLNISTPHSVALDHDGKSAGKVLFYHNAMNCGQWDVVRVSIVTVRPDYWREVAEGPFITPSVESVNCIDDDDEEPTPDDFELPLPEPQPVVPRIPRPARADRSISL